MSDSSTFLGELHPSGFGHVPIALLRDGRVGATEILVYAAISSAVDFTGMIGPVRMRRLQDRSRRERRAIKKAIDNLQDLGYVEIRRTRTGVLSFRLLPTSLIEELPLERAADATAMTPELTGQAGGLKKGSGPGCRPPTPVAGPFTNDAEMSEPDQGPGAQRQGPPPPRPRPPTSTAKGGSGSGTPSSDLLQNSSQKAFRDTLHQRSKSNADAVGETTYRQWETTFKNQGLTEEERDAMHDRAASLVGSGWEDNEAYRLALHEQNAVR